MELPALALVCLCTHQQRAVGECNQGEDPVNNLIVVIIIGNIGSQQWVLLFPAVEPSSPTTDFFRALVGWHGRTVGRYRRFESAYTHTKLK